MNIETSMSGIIYAQDLKQTLTFYEDGIKMLDVSSEEVRTNIKNDLIAIIRPQLVVNGDVCIYVSEIDDLYDVEENTCYVMTNFRSDWSRLNIRKANLRKDHMITQGERDFKTLDEMVEVTAKLLVNSVMQLHEVLV